MSETLTLPYKAFRLAFALRKLDAVTREVTLMPSLKQGAPALLLLARGANCLATWHFPLDEPLPSELLPLTLAIADLKRVVRAAPGMLGFDPVRVKVAAPDSVSGLRRCSVKLGGASLRMWARPARKRPPLGGLPLSPIPGVTRTEGPGAWLSLDHLSMLGRLVRAGWPELARDPRFRYIQLPAIDSTAACFGIATPELTLTVYLGTRSVEGANNGA